VWRLEMEKMKDAREVLVEFMRGKAKRLSEYGIDTDRYFSEEDKNDIMSWTHEDAANIASEIYLSIKSGTKGLVNSVCPFCIKLDNYKIKRNVCGQCGYGVRHGDCYDVDGDYFLISKLLKSYILMWDRDFDNDFYKKLWDSITEVKK
jgi:hypothetical protein